MLKRTITIAVACALLFQVCGCAAMRKIQPDKMNDDTFYRHITITTVNRHVMDRYKVAVKTDSSTVYLEYKNGEHEEMPVSNVRQIRVMRFSPVKTVASVALLATITGIAVTAIADFFWSLDCCLEGVILFGGG